MYVTIWGKIFKGDFFIELLHAEAEVIYEQLMSIFDEEKFKRGTQLHHAEKLYDVLKEQFGGEE
jgi:hypothetical protein